MRHIKLWGGGDAGPLRLPNVRQPRDDLSAQFHDGSSPSRLAGWPYRAGGERMVLPSESQGTDRAFDGLLSSSMRPACRKRVSTARLFFAVYGRALLAPQQVQGTVDPVVTDFTTQGLRALTAKGMLGWRHAFGDVTPLLTIRLAGGGNAFSIGGVPIARDAAVIEVGLDHAITPSAILGFTYGRQFGSGMSDQSVKANLNVKF